MAGNVKAVIALLQIMNAAVGCLDCMT